MEGKKKIIINLATYFFHLQAAKIPTQVVDVPQQASGRKNSAEVCDEITQVFVFVIILFLSCSFPTTHTTTKTGCAPKRGHGRKKSSPAEEGLTAPIELGSCGVLHAFMHA